MPIRIGPRIPPLLSAIVWIGFSWHLAAGVASGAQSPVDLKTFVTRSAVSGIPYAQARSYGSQAIPALLTMLSDRSMEQYWDKIIYVLGCIGDPAATAPLLDFLKTQQGEISVQAFQATLAILPALGHIARGGDAIAFNTIVDFTRADHWERAGLAFSYGRYRGEALGEVLGRTAIQGLGIAGTPEALKVLDGLRTDRTVRQGWSDNIAEALSLNNRVRLLGAQRAFDGVQR
jgi:HEAT repeat protein